MPPTALTDDTGRPANLAQYRGKALLVTFVYTHCSGAASEDGREKLVHDVVAAWTKVMNNDRFDLDR